jgi:hypothetical protein
MKIYTALEYTVSLLEFSVSGYRGVLSMRDFEPICEVMLVSENMTLECGSSRSTNL